MVDFYGEVVLKTRWRRFVYWIFVKKLKPVKFRQILIIVLHLHKFKGVAFYNVYLNFIVHLFPFLDLYPNLAPNFCRILLSLWKICGFFCIWNLLNPILLDHFRLKCRIPLRKILPVPFPRSHEITRKSNRLLNVQTLFKIHYYCIHLTKLNLTIFYKGGLFIQAPRPVVIVSLIKRTGSVKLTTTLHLVPGLRTQSN